MIIHLIYPSHDFIDVQVIKKWYLLAVLSNEEAEKRGIADDWHAHMPQEGRKCAPKSE